MNKFISYLVALVMLAGCATVTQNDEFVVPEYGSNRIVNKITIDSDFSPQYQEAALKAIDIWVEATNGIVNPEIVVEQISFETATFGSIVALNRNHPKVVEQTIAFEFRPTGWATGIFMVVVVDEEVPEDYFPINTFAHELGHHLSLGHIENDPTDLMNPVINETICVSQATLDEFCTKNICVEPLLTNCVSEESVFVE